MKSANIYLNFSGNTEKAFNFYKSVFGGKFLFLQRFKEVPPDPNNIFSKDEEEKIMHVALKIGNDTLMGSDVPKSMADKLKMGNNFYISIDADNKEEVDKLFKKLSKGGKVEMPPGEMFWGSYFCMLTDKFGVQWMIGFSKSPMY